MSRYSKNASDNRKDMKLLKDEITKLEFKYQQHPSEELRDQIIDLKKDLIFTEIRLNNDLRAMYRHDGTDTFDQLDRLQETMQKDITSFQNDLVEKRNAYIEWSQKEMARKYPEPLSRAAKKEQIKDIANYQYELFQNARLLLALQNKKLNYCKRMSDADIERPLRLQTKLRKMYAEDFNNLFRHTVSSINLVGIEGAKELLEMRQTIIEQAQEEDIKKKIIIERPSELQKICDRRNSVLGYKKNLEGEIESYKEVIQFDEEVRAAEKAYYESGQFERDKAREQEEERKRYDPEWNIPDEGYKDEDGNIVNLERDDDDERDI